MNYVAEQDSPQARWRCVAALLAPPPSEQPAASSPCAGPCTGFALLSGYAAILIGSVAWRLRRSDA